MADYNYLFDDKFTGKRSPLSELMELELLHELMSDLGDICWPCGEKVEVRASSRGNSKKGWLLAASAAIAAMWKWKGGKKGGLGSDEGGGTKTEGGVAITGGNSTSSSLVEVLVVSMSESISNPPFFFIEAGLVIDEGPVGVEKVGVVRAWLRNANMSMGGSKPGVGENGGWENRGLGGRNEGIIGGGIGGATAGGGMGGTMGGGGAWDTGAPTGLKLLTLRIADNSSSKSLSPLPSLKRFRLQKNLKIHEENSRHFMGG